MGWFDVLLRVTALVTILGFYAVAYALYDAWQDYKAGLKTNGWRALYARSLFRSQFMRFIEGGLLVAVVVSAAVWPLTEPRPIIVTLLIRLGLIVVVMLISVGSLMDMLAKRKFVTMREKSKP